MSQVEHVAHGPPDDEQRCLVRLRADTHAHQDRVLGAPAGARCSAFASRCRERGVDAGREALDRGRLEQHGQRQHHGKRVVQLGKQARREHAVPAQIEERVAHAHAIEAQRLHPEPSQSALRVGRRLDEDPLRALAGVFCR